MAQQGGATFLVGGRVWLATEEDNRQQLDWTAAEIIKVVNADRVVVRYMEPPTAPHRPPTARDEEVDVRKLQHRNPENLEEAEDLTTLSELNAPSILHTLASRYSKNRIYTYSGTVLISVNPYQRYPELYTRKVLETYFNQPLGKMPPHVYAIAEAAYRSMLFDSRSQSILVSGESGAGKTETTKVLLQFFALVGKSESQLEEKVLQSTPILEAFGNAKTIWNDNSSRFGKFIKIEFDRTGNITGASILTYLLEKSRIVRPQRNERNYHIFYRLLAGASEQQRRTLRLTAAQDYYYLRQSECATIEDVDDTAEFEHTVKAMDIVGISRAEQDQIFIVLAAILHLGNVAFLGDDKARLKDTESLSVVASLLNCEARDLERALLTREVKTGNESIVVPMSHEKAVNSRDTLAMLLYSRLFDWLVAKINANIVRTAPPHSFISILDIYGFECFEVNSFEQFCINYANEKLQQQFNNHIFKLEQEEYVREKIDWSYVQFKDNQECIDLIEGAMGVLTILDEESRFPKATDDTFLTKLVGTHRKHINFKLPEVGEAAFAVIHYAGRVKYYARGFLEKNKDYLVAEHLNLLSKGSPFVANLIAAQRASLQNSGGPRGRDSVDPGPSPRGRQSMDMSSRTSLDRRTSDADLKSPRNKPAASSFAFVSVASQFRDSLAVLMDTIGQTEPHYIRCVKPNDQKRPRDYVRKRVLHQLRSGGVLEAVRIAAAGFPTRIPLDEFFYRYRLLMPGAKPERAKEACAAYFKQLSLGPDKLQFGVTKLFLRAGIIAMLESLRIARLNACATRIQKHWRRFVARRKYVREHKALIRLQTVLRVVQARREVDVRKTTRAAVRLQKHIRRVLQRLRYIRLRRTALLVQSSFRAQIAHRHFLSERRRRAVELLQSMWRMHVQRIKFLALYRAVVIAQTRLRGRIARRTLRQLKIEARSVGEMSKQKEEAQRRALEAEKKRKQAEEENAKLRAELAGASATKTKELEAQVEKERLRLAEIEAEAAALRVWQAEAKAAKEAEEKRRQEDEKKAAEEAQRLREEENRQRAEGEARRRETESKQRAEEEQKRAEEKNKRRQEKQQHREAEAKSKAEEEAKRRADEQAQREAAERARGAEMDAEMKRLRDELASMYTAEEERKRKAEAEFAAKSAQQQQTLAEERRKMDEERQKFETEKEALLTQERTRIEGEVRAKFAETQQKLEAGEAAWATLVSGLEQRIQELTADNDALRVENSELKTSNASLSAAASAASAAAAAAAAAANNISPVSSQSTISVALSVAPSASVASPSPSTAAEPAGTAPVAAPAKVFARSREIEIPVQSLAAPAMPKPQPSGADDHQPSVSSSSAPPSSSDSTPAPSSTPTVPSSSDAHELTALLRVKDALIAQLTERQMKAEDEAQDWRARAENAEMRLAAAKSPRSPSPRPSDARADQRLASAQEEMARQAELIASLRTELQSKDARLLELQSKDTQLAELEKRLVAQTATIEKLSAAAAAIPAPALPPAQLSESEVVRQLKAEMYDLAKQLEREKEKAAKAPAPVSTDAQELLAQLEATEKRLEAAVNAKKETADQLRLKEGQIATVSAAVREAQKEAQAKNETIALLKASLKTQSAEYNLPADLDRLTRAHQAHQTQCVFLQNEIGNLEDHVKTLGKVHQEALGELRGQLNDAVLEAKRLRKLVYEKYSRRMQGGVAALETEFESACHELFFALATGIKLNYLLAGQNINEDVSTLYASVKQQGMHFSRFNAFLRRNLVPEKP